MIEKFKNPKVKGQVSKVPCLPAGRKCPSLRDGFSLLELLIYIALLSVMMLSIGAIFISVGQSKGRIDSQNEVSSALKFAGETIKQDLKVATNVTTPKNDVASSCVAGGSTCLCLNSANSCASGTYISYKINGSNQILRTSSGTETILTPTSINVSALTFEQYQNVQIVTGTTLKVLSSIKTTITANYVSTAAEKQYSETKQFTVLLGNIFSSPVRDGGINGI